MLQAYIGLGAGLASVGALLVVVVGGLLMLVGLVWYPALRLVRFLRQRGTQAGEGAAAPVPPGEGSPEPEDRSRSSGGPGDGD